MFAFSSFLAFTLMVAFIAWWRTRQDDQSVGENYFLAGRSLPWYVVSGSLMLTNLSTEQLVGLNGGAYMHGFVVMAWEVVAAVALVFMAWKFLPMYWSGRVTTVPELLEKRYDKATRSWVGLLFLLGMGISFLPFILYSGALAMNGLFDLGAVLGVEDRTALIIMVWAIGIVGGLYAILGGLEAVAVSDTINGVGLLLGGLLIPVLGLMALGEGDALAGWARIVDNQRPMLDPVGASDANIPFGTLFTGMLVANLFYWCTNQFIIQRTFGAKSLAESQKGVLGAAVLKLFGPFYLVLPGIIALELFGASLADGDQAYPSLVEAVLPAPLVGFFAAVMFGAILSSFNSCLHSAATLFGLDIFKSLLRPQATDRQVVFAGKAFGIGLGLMAILIAPLIAHAPEGLYTLMKKLVATFSVPVFALVLSGMLLPKAPAFAAKISLLVGIVFYSVFTWILTPTWGGVPIHWLHISGINFVLLMTIMASAARWFPKALPGGEPDSQAASVPEKATAAPQVSWRWCGLTGWAILVAVVLLYLWLHFL